MQNNLKRAWSDTLGVLGVSHFSLRRLFIWAVVSIAFVALIYLWRGRSDAVNQASDYVLYAAAFFGVAFIPLFLWNLWLSPYRLLNEGIDKLIRDGRNRTGATGGSGVSYRQPDVKHWEGTKMYKLGDAACLWVNVRPYDPIDDDRATGKFAQLSSAMIIGDIPYQPRGLRVFGALVEGKTLWPEYSYPVSAIALRKYADKTNDVPTFLQSVVVPTEPKSEEAVKELTPES